MKNRASICQYQSVSLGKLGKIKQKINPLLLRQAHSYQSNLVSHPTTRACVTKTRMEVGGSTALNPPQGCFDVESFHD